MIVTDGLIKYNPLHGKSDYQKHTGQYIDKTSTGKFRVRKYINGKTIYFGTYDSFNEAVSIRDRLVENNWDKSILITDEDKVNEYYKYIRRNGDYCYDVNRPANNKKGLPRYMGTCTSIEEALYYRDLAKTNDYIIGKPQEYDLITDNLYINEGLDYPVPERLRSKDRNKSSYGKGYITPKGPNSFQVWYNKKYYGSYTTKEYAEYIQLKLNENNWNISKLEEIKKGYPEYYTYILHFWRYIYYDSKHDSWECKKYLGKGNTVTFMFKNPYDVLYERDLYEKYNWDLDSVVELAKLEENPYKSIELPPYPTRKVLVHYGLNEEYYSNLLLDFAFFIREFDISSKSAMEETMDITTYVIDDVLSKFNIKWRDFKELARSGEDLLSILTYSKTITPNLKPVKSKSNYVYFDKSRKYSPYKIQRKGVYYGSYSNKRIALRIVKQLEKVNWDKNQLKSIVENIGYIKPSQNGDTAKYIYLDKRNPKNIRYYIHRKRVRYGTYDSKEIAEKIVEELIEVDWDKNELKNIQWKVSKIMGG